MREHEHIVKITISYINQNFICVYRYINPNDQIVREISVKERMERPNHPPACCSSPLDLTWDRDGWLKPASLCRCSHKDLPARPRHWWQVPTAFMTASPASSLVAGPNHGQQGTSPSSQCFGEAPYRCTALNVFAKSLTFAQFQMELAQIHVIIMILYCDLPWSWANILFWPRKTSIWTHIPKELISTGHQEPCRNLNKQFCLSIYIVGYLSKISVARQHHIVS